MPKYGSKSRKNLATCHKDWHTICLHVIEFFDNSVIEGHRTTERQQFLFNSNPPRTKLDGINKKSKHQSSPSMAIDLYPYPIKMDGSHKSKARFYFQAGIVIGTARMLYDRGLISNLVRWGGDWDMDNDFEDQSFDDLPHFELYVPSDKK